MTMTLNRQIALRLSLRRRGATAILVAALFALLALDLPLASPAEAAVAGLRQNDAQEEPPRDVPREGRRRGEGRGSPVVGGPEARLYGSLTLIGDDLAAIAIRGFAVDGDRLVYWPEASVEGSADAESSESMPLQRCLAILADRPAMPQPNLGLLDLVDGGRLPGSPRMVDGAIVWRHRWIGDVELEVERIRSLRLGPLASATAPAVADRTDIVILANGDRIEGIVRSIASTVLIERVERDEGGEVAIPFERIASLSLIAPPIDFAWVASDRSAATPRVWLVDGTVVDGAPFLPRTEPDGPPDGRQSLPAAMPESLALRLGAVQASSGDSESPAVERRVEALAVRGFAPDPSRVVPLASLAPAEIATSGALPRYRLPTPETLPGLWTADVAPVIVRGPSLVRYRLPVDGCVFVARVAVEDPDPRWTDAELILRDGNREVLRRRITAETTPEWIRVPLASRVLEIEVTAGRRGPVRDAVRFEFALLRPPAVGR